MASTETANALRAAVEDFLYAEAGLLDDERFTEWLALFTPTAHYWIPASDAGTDPTQEVSIVYDDLSFLSERVWRLESGLAYAQEPRSRTGHLVSNVQILSGGTTLAPDDPIETRSQFVVTEFRRVAQHSYAGRYRHRLWRDDTAAAGFRIELKKVELVNAGGHLGNLSLLL